MIDFNPARSLCHESLQNCKKIEQNFLRLPSIQKKKLISKLSSSERCNLLKIIENEGKIYLEKNICKNLSDQINEIQKSAIKITRKNDTRLGDIDLLKRKISNFASGVAYFFNYLTASKTLILIKEVLLKQNPKEDNLPHISNTELVNLLGKANKALQPGEKVNLAKILQEKGFSTEIKKQIFSNDFSLKNMNLEEITFTDCKFDWTPCSNSNLRNVKFNNCDIYNLSLMKSKLEDCIFENCDMRETMFTGATLKGVSFLKTNLISSSFEDAFLTDCIFKNVILPATHFFEAIVQNSSIIDSNLRDTVFFETFDQFQMDHKTKKTAIVTRPTTAIILNAEDRGVANPKAYMKLDQSAGTIPLRITSQAQMVTKEGVNHEVETALAKVGKYDKNKAPIPQRLITELATIPNSESAIILKKAEKLASQVNSFLLPGGEDIPPALYGQEKNERTNWGDDYRRSILELAIFHQSFTKGIPLMGICRGFQMSNVYFGAHLIQHIEGHQGLQSLKLSTPEKKGLYTKVFEHNIVSTSYHHQGVPEDSPAAEHLQSSVSYQGIVKAAELKESGAIPMILLQFHPEFYNAKTADSVLRAMLDRIVSLCMSNENELFWKILSDSAKAHRTKQAVLRQLPKAATLCESGFARRKAALEKLENQRVNVFNVYIKDHFNRKQRANLP